MTDLSDSELMNVRNAAEQCRTFPMFQHKSDAVIREATNEITRRIMLRSYHRAIDLTLDVPWRGN